MKYSKRIVLLIIILNVLFTIGVLAVFWHTGNEPVALVTAWFGTWTVELLAIAGIKVKKIKENSHE